MVLPAALFAGLLTPLVASVIVTALAWCVAILVIAFHKSRMDEIRRALPKADGSGGELVDEIASQLQDMRRYYNSAFAVQLDESIPTGHVESRLCSIAEIAQEELRARSVEISLYDEESRLWSRTLLVGEPFSVEGQSMLAESPAALEETTVLRTPTGAVVASPLRFSGAVFGAIRAELFSGHTPDKGDLDIIKLCANQCASVLANSRFTQDLIRMKRLADESVKVKTGFLANLSHELRGPLGIILNGTELILDGLCGEITDHTRDTVRMVKSSGEHLLDLVNDVLDYAKVEAGKVVPKPVEVSVKELLVDLGKITRSQAESKKHKVIVEPVDETLGMVCDKRHARQMLLNFLTNAIKYTPEGGTITVSAEKTAANRVRISVKDSGVGIPEDQRGKVFAAFERVDHKYSSAQTGTGLGMPLTKRLAEANGGLVDFESQENVGSTFWLTLPYVQRGSEETTGTRLATQAVLPLGRGETVLLVDPDAHARGLVETYLQKEGFSVFAAGSGRDVLRALRETNIAIAVLENDLPDLSGVELVAALRAHPKGASVPVVLVSAKAFVFDVEHFLKMGVDRCLSKPVDLREVAVTARRLIDESRETSAR